MVWLIKVWYVRAHCTLRATRYGNREEIMTSIIHGLVRIDDQYHHYYHLVSANEWGKNLNLPYNLNLNPRIANWSKKIAHKALYEVK